MDGTSDPPVGIFGGTFDPVHHGHLEVAGEVGRKLRIDDFRMVPASDPPHREKPFASARHRLCMLKLAIEGQPELAIDEREIHRDGSSWMVVTLASLRAELPASPLLLVIGQDAANSFDEWYQWRRIFSLAHLLIMTRAGEPANYSPHVQAELDKRFTHDPAELRLAFGGRVAVVEVSRVDISSTAIRQKIRAGEKPVEWVPSRVLEYIERHGLYC